MARKAEDQGRRGHLNVPYDFGGEVNNYVPTLTKFGYILTL